MSIPNSGRPISLDDLAALNDEMAALIRAGVPLELGLQAGADLAGRSGEIAGRLSAQLQSGQSLEQILAADEGAFPPVWRAIVLAGLRSGQLDVALQGLSVTSRRLAEQRRSIGLALIYPLIIAALAYALVVAIVMSAPVIAAVFRDIAGVGDPLLQGLIWLQERWVWWAATIPLVCGLLLLIGWRRLGRRSLSAKPAPAGRWHWPGLRQSLWDDRLASFTETLAVLVRQQVPLQESLVLAADASGDRALIQAAREAAGRLEGGERLSGAELIPRPLPRLLGWLIASDVSGDELSDALSQSAEVHRRRARRAAAWNAMYLPILLTAVLGGTATLLAGLAVLGPVWRLLYALGQA